MTDWLDDPAGTIFSLRRDAFDGTLEQWAVIPDAAGVALLHAGFKILGWSDWQPVDGRFSDLADVLRQVPGLRTAHARVLNVYETHPEQSGLDDFECAARLDLRPDEGDDEPDDWPDTVAGDHPMTLGAVSIGGYNP